MRLYSSAAAGSEAGSEAAAEAGKASLCLAFLCDSLLKVLARRPAASCRSCCLPVYDGKLCSPPCLPSLGLACLGRNAWALTRWIFFWVSFRAVPLTCHSNRKAGHAGGRGRNSRCRVVTSAGSKPGRRCWGRARARPAAGAAPWRRRRHARMLLSLGHTHQPHNPAFSCLFRIAGSLP